MLQSGAVWVQAVKFGAQTRALRGEGGVCGLAQVELLLCGETGCADRWATSRGSGRGSADEDSCTRHGEDDRAVAKLFAKEHTVFTGGDRSVVHIASG